MTDLGNLDAQLVGRFDDPHNTTGLSFAALLNLALKSVSDAARARFGLPAPSIAYANGGGTIVSTSFAAIPTVPLSTTITVPSGGKFARLSYNVHAICTAGNMDVGLAVSGATNIAATHAWDGFAHSAIDACYAMVFGSALASYRVEKIVFLNAGSNTITAQARLGGAGGTKQIGKQLITVELI